MTLVKGFVDWWRNLLYATSDVSVEYAILSYFRSVEEKCHDCNAIIPGTTVILKVPLMFPKFNRLDVSSGLEQLVYEGKLYEVYKDEYRLKKEVL